MVQLLDDYFSTKEKQSVSANHNAFPPDYSHLQELHYQKIITLFEESSSQKEENLSPHDELPAVNL
jgi:hypothetical protein